MRTIQSTWTMFQQAFTILDRLDWSQDKVKQLMIIWKLHLQFPDIDFYGLYEKYKETAESAKTVK